MLSSQQKLAKRLVKLRIAKKMSQYEVARLAGFCQPYLAQVEKGVRPISARALERLEAVYEKKLSRQLWKGVGRRGRPAFVPLTHQAMREFGGAIRGVWAEAEVVAPRHVQAHQVRRSSDPLWPMALHLSLQAREEVELLEKLREEDEFFWRQFNSLRFDSWSEKRLLVRVGLLGGQLLGVRLDRLGCALPVVDGVTGGKPGLHRGFVLKGEKASVVWCPQVAVKSEAAVLCVDNLLVVSDGKRRVTVAVEVDGGPYHGDQEHKRWRDRVLGVPVLHVDAADLGKRGLITQILRWAHAQLPAA